jgi:flagellar biosynthetic protein FlhB
MAENADGQEKTEDASDKKVREAREKGQVLRAKELGTLLITLLAALWFYWLGAYMMHDITSNMALGLNFERDHAFDIKKASNLVFAQFINALWLIAPFVLVMTFIGIVSNIVIGGWNFSTHVWMPNFSKLNPISGIARMFSMNALVELLKALLKFTLMMAISILFLYGVLLEIRNLGLMDINQGLLEAGEHLVLAFLVVSLGLIVIAMIDTPYQIWHHNEEMKMTQQEVKDEYKNTDGNPEIKGRIRRMQREMAMRRMMQDVMSLLPTQNIMLSL